MAGFCSNTPFCGGCIMWLQLVSNHFKRVFCLFFWFWSSVLRWGAAQVVLFYLLELLAVRHVRQADRAAGQGVDMTSPYGPVPYPMAFAADGWSWCFKGRMVPMPNMYKM